MKTIGFNAHFLACNEIKYIKKAIISKKLVTLKKDVPIKEKLENFILILPLILHMFRKMEKKRKY